MKYTGNLRKMESQISDDGKVVYNLRLYRGVEPQKDAIPLSSFIGKKIGLRSTGKIHCVVTGEQISKSYGQGFSWEAFQSSPLADQSIMKPELSTAHLGIARRDLDWEIAMHVVPHYVYLAFTSSLKVGVTRYNQIPTRWIDQGALAGIPVYKVPYRQLAGEIEVLLKEHFKDKTHWSTMLKTQELPKSLDLEAERSRLHTLLGETYSLFEVQDKPTSLHFPYHAPQAVKSVKLPALGEYSGKLMGIKGQYLLLEDNRVINIRAHSGYETEWNL